MEAEILCIGHASHDFTFLLDEFPQENRKYTISEWVEAGGGPAANAACLAASWGASCAFAGVVGDDASGRLVVEELRAAGIDLSRLEIRQNHPTPHSAIIVNRTAGSRTILNRRIPAAPLRLGSAGGSSSGASSAGAAIGRTGGPSVILVDGHELEASLEAIERFPDAVTVLDAGSLRKSTRILLERVDWPVCSETFAREVTGAASLDSPDALRRCLRRLAEISGKNAAVTLGERGLIFETEGNAWTLPALPVSAVDTTAAGDIFHGAFAFGLLRGLPPVEAFRLAVVAAGLSVTRPGGRGSVPSLEETEAAYRGFEGRPQPL